MTSEYEETRDLWWRTHEYIHGGKQTTWQHIIVAVQEKIPPPRLPCYPIAMACIDAIAQAWEMENTRAELPDWDDDKATGLAGARMQTELARLWSEHRPPEDADPPFIEAMAKCYTAFSQSMPPFARGDSPKNKAMPGAGDIKAQVLGMIPVQKLVAVFVDTIMATEPPAFKAIKAVLQEVIDREGDVKKSKLSDEELVKTYLGKTPFAAPFFAHIIHE